MTVHNPSLLAAVRGEPSYVWRDGQERRLRMIGHWADLRSAMLSEASRLFQTGDSDVRIELKFWLRAGRGKLVYQEDLTVRVRSYRIRDTAEMDAETCAWFDRAVDRIDKIDKTVFIWHGQDLVAG